MTKKIFVSTFLIILCNLTTAQEKFSHSIGATGFIGTRKASLHAIGVTYSPRYNVLEIGNSSTLSIGTNIGIGYNIDYNFVDDNQITFHIPITIDYNFGLGSGRESLENNNGGFIGIGYSFEQAGRNINNGIINDVILVKKAMNGPIANVGYRFKIGSELFGIRASYLYGTGDFGGGYLSTLSLQYIFN